MAWKTDDQIITLWDAGERSILEIARQVGITGSNVRKRLEHLYEDGILNTRERYTTLKCPKGHKCKRDHEYTWCAECGWEPK